METTINNTTDFLYLRIAKNFESQILKNVLRIGDKLPSLRSICKLYEVSQTTAMQAYYYLEAKSLIESRPQSGYYVSNSPKKFPMVPQTSKPGSLGNNNLEDIITIVNNHRQGNNSIINLSLSAPAPELLPLAKLNKSMINAMRDLPANGTSYEDVQGNKRLRRQIARWSHNMETGLADGDIVTTTGCINAVAYALGALTQPGDTIVVESPVYFGILRMAKNAGLKVIELPTNSQTGIELEAVKKTLETNKIKLCILVSNFSNPLGSCMPDEHKREMVKLIQKHNIPLIEDDLYGDIYFGASRPKSCKTFDESGLVLWCGSVSKTLAPGYRVGWIAPGQFKDLVIKQKLYSTVASPSLTQEAVAIFLETGRYENHLRKLRQALHGNALKFSRAIGDYFPEGTKVSRPQGGFVIWVEMDKRVNTLDLYEKAIKNNISVAPGLMFTLQRQFTNCMRLSFGITWSDEVERSLKTLGALAKSCFSSSIA